MKTKDTPRRALAAIPFLVLLSCSGPSSPDEGAIPTVPGEEDRLATAGPESVLLGLEAAYTQQDLAAVNRLFSGRYVFHTHPEFLGLEELTRTQAVRALRALFADPEVESVTLDLEFGPAEPAGDLDHPEWLEFDVSAATLEVSRRREDGEMVVLEVEGTPARFIVGRGPGVSRNAPWQIMSQWDLYESDSQGERSTVSSTWSELLVSYMGTVQPGGY